MSELGVNPPSQSSESQRVDALVRVGQGSGDSKPSSLPSSPGCLLIRMRNGPKRSICFLGPSGGGSVLKLRSTLVVFW